MGCAGRAFPLRGAARAQVHDRPESRDAAPSLARDRRTQAARSGTGVAGHVIAAAAIIMVAVFIVFTIFGVPTIQAAGLGAAVAVVASAALVQLAFMPALMTLMGDRIWWLPRWLDRVLPRIELE
ncbi:MAG TPA: MMPL family transporter [Conexibacter sp.]|nr:MMPL family transporter [Conexibacter sp.]